MAEKNNNNAIREIPKHNVHVNASVQDRSIIKDLIKESMTGVIIPQTRSMVRNASDNIFDMFVEALKNLRDGILYPDGNIPAKKPSNGSGYYTGNTPYQSFSRPIGTYQSSNTQVRGRDPIGSRPGNEVKYIWVETEEKAKLVIGTLKEDIDNYGKAKVATLYEMVGERTTMADFWYGWTDSSAIGYFEDTSRRSGEFRWFIDLPKPVDIRNI